MSAIDRNALVSLVEEYWAGNRSNAWFINTLLALVEPDPRIDAVRALHHKDSTAYGFPLRCVECAHEWPCATIRALGGTS